MGLISVYSDMDGCLTDFAGHSLALTGVDIHEMKPQEKDGFVDRIDLEGPDFWRYMPWMDDGPQLLDGIMQIYGRPKLLSYAWEFKYAEEGKKLWAKDRGLDICVDREKSKRANIYSILIDDYETYLKEWTLAGGYSILHSQDNYTTLFNLERAIDYMSKLSRQER